MDFDTCRLKYNSGCIFLAFFFRMDFLYISYCWKSSRFQHQFTICYFFHPLKKTMLRRPVRFVLYLPLLHRPFSKSHRPSHQHDRFQAQMRHCDNPSWQPSFQTSNSPKTIPCYSLPTSFVLPSPASLFCLPCLALHSIPIPSRRRVCSFVSPLYKTPPCAHRWFEIHFPSR